MKVDSLYMSEALATRHGLYHSTLPSARLLILKTHLQPMGCFMGEGLELSTCHLGRAP